MDKINEAMKTAAAAFKAQYGEDAKLENGESIVAVFNNGTLIMEPKNGEFSVNVIYGKAFVIDADI